MCQKSGRISCQKNANFLSTSWQDVLKKSSELKLFTLLKLFTTTKLIRGSFINNVIKLQGREGLGVWRKEAGHGKDDVGWRGEGEVGNNQDSDIPAWRNQWPTP